MSHEPYNAGERLHVRRAAREAKAAEGLDHAVVRDLMSTPVGRAWMWRKLTACHIFSTSHTGNALNTAYAEGERNIGLMILADIMAACPEQYIQMTREDNERHLTANDRRSRGNTDFDGRDSGAWDSASASPADSLDTR